MTDLAAGTAEAARIVAGVRDDQLTGPTPCPGTSVAAMLDHLSGLAVAFRMAAEEVRPGGGPSADAANLANDWRTRLPAQLAELAAAWRAPGAWEGTTEAGGVELPASAMGVVALNEVVVHGWDLAVATRQEYRPDRASVQACREMVGDRTDATDESGRLFGQTGRDPGWWFR